MLTRHDIQYRIEAHLAGKLSAKALSAWAFDCFYAHNIGENSFAEEDADLVAAVLDDLMFADSPPFLLDEATLHALVARLQPLSS